MAGHRIPSVEGQSTTDGRVDTSVPSSPPRAVTIGIVVGIAAALVGFVDGIALMVKRKVTSCPNGHVFSAGTTNFNCYAHPRAADALAISAISVGVGAIVVLLAYLSVATLTEPA